MADVEQNVVTKFTGEDNISGTLMNIASNAAGVGAALFAAQTIAGLMMGPINRAMSGMNSIIAVQSQAANTQLELTATLRAYEVFGQTSAQISASTHTTAEAAAATAQAFEVAGEASTRIMQRINAAAATLPGEAQQYLQVFQQALPAALANTHQSVSNIIDLTNHGAAIAIANGIDAAQAGRDMMSMLQGHADTMNRTYQVLGPLMHRSATDHRAITSSQFNAMTGEARFAAMMTAINTYLPMLDRMGATWDAMEGAWKSSVNTIIQQGTTEVFHEAVRVYGEMNTMLTNYTEAIVNVEKVFSHWAVEGFGQLRTEATAAFNHLKQMGQQLAAQPWFHGMMRLGTGAAQSLAGATVGVHSNMNSRIGVATGVIAGVGMLAGGGSGVAGALAFGSLMKWATHLENINQVMTIFHSVLANVLPFIGRVSTMFDGITTAGAAFLSGFIPALADTAKWIVGAMVMLGDAAMWVGNIIGPTLAPMMVWFGHELATLMHHVAASKVMMGILATVLGALVVGALAASVGVWGPILAIGAAIAAVAAALAWLVNNVIDLGRELGLLDAPAATSPETPAQQANPPWMQSIIDAIHHVTPEGDTGLNGANPRTGQPTPRTRGGTTQDFRFSRFDITQKFAEGFDPDRIASVFVTDLEAMANNRLDSSFSPAFSLS